MDGKNRFQWPVRPLAAKENMVQGAHYRFTVLTSRLIRLEYSPEGCFEDRASQSVFYRDFPAVSFALTRENGVLVNGNEATPKVCREENTTCVAVAAAVTDQVELVITGKTLIHDNADVPQRISRLLQRSYLGTGEKETLAKICASDKPLHEKTTKMYWQARQTNAVSDALKELLSLTQCEYLGSQL